MLMDGLLDSRGFRRLWETVNGVADSFGSAQPVTFARFASVCGGMLDVRCSEFHIFVVFERIRGLQLQSYV